MGTFTKIIDTLKTNKKLIFYLLSLSIILSLILVLIFVVFNKKNTENQNDLFSITSPLQNQIVQRKQDNTGEIILSGFINKVFMHVEDAKIEYQIMDDKNNIIINWKSVFKPTQFLFGNFMEKIKLKAGLYNINVRLSSIDFITNKRVILNTTNISCGVGDIFVVCGQSNSANWGEEKLSTQTKKVFSFNGIKWVQSVDPQLGADGLGGSFIPPLGDMLNMKFNIPIGFVPCGVGGTSIVEWTPQGTLVPYWLDIHSSVDKVDDNYISNGYLYDQLIFRMKLLGKEGFKAVLWIQGEGDTGFLNPNDANKTLLGMKYATYLSLIINQTRKDLNCNVIWLTTQTTYVKGVIKEDIREAQASLWKDGTSLEGIDTDKLIGIYRGLDNVHFSKEGQIALATEWFKKLEPIIQSNPSLC
jgi:hypothetical protein